MEGGEKLIKVVPSVQLGCLKWGGCVTEGVDFVNVELVEMSSWSHAACLKVSFFGEH